MILITTAHARYNNKSYNVHLILILLIVHYMNYLIVCVYDYA